MQVQYSDVLIDAPLSGKMTFKKSAFPGKATMKLSATIITYNEEKHIAACIRSLEGVADEVIVLDSHSTDRTIAIAKEMGARVFTHPFLGYGPQKNKALEYTAHPIVLSLDADERIDDTLRASILNLKEQHTVIACSINRTTNYCGKFIRHGSWYPDRKIRLFDKRTARWSDDPIHESILLNDPDAVIRLKGEILHYSYNSIESHVLQNNKFSSMSAEALYNKGKRANVLHLTVSPLFAFIKGYIFRLGFLDGLYGFVVAINASHLTFLKYAKLYRMQKQKKDVAT